MAIKKFTPIPLAPSATNTEAAKLLALRATGHPTTPVTTVGGNAAAKGVKQSGTKLTGGRF